MARQRLGDKKLRRLRRQLGLPIVRALVRGGTNHRVDLILEGGQMVHYWPASGQLETGGRLETAALNRIALREADGFVDRMCKRIPGAVRK